MQRHFVLPATVAAAVHLALLFGWPGGRIPGAAAKPQAVPVDDGPKIFVTDPPPPEAGDETNSGGSAAPLPDIPDVARPESRSPFEIPVPAVPPSRIAPEPITHVTVRGFGGGDGPAIGPSLSNTIGAELLDHQPTARVQIAPNYPGVARSQGLTGEVVVEFLVDESGRVQDPRVVRSTDPMFDASALTAVEKWRFEPGTRYGRVVRFRMAVPIQFRLNDE